MTIDVEREVKHVISKQNHIPPQIAGEILCVTKISM